MAGKRTIEISGETTYSYQQFVLEALNRINSLSSGEGSSYNTQAHESCINDLWCSIPMSKKRVCGEDGVSFLEAWNNLADGRKDYFSISPDERKKVDMERILEKRQILTECLHSMKLLFSGSDPFLDELWDRGE